MIPEDVLKLKCSLSYPSIYEKSMVYSCDEILYSKENKCYKTICNNIDESRKQGLGKQKKPDRRGHVIRFHIHKV